MGKIQFHNTNTSNTTAGSSPTLSGFSPNPARAPQQAADSVSGGFVRQVPPLPVTPAVGQVAKSSRENFVENTFTFKPVFWRLLVVRFIPFFIGFEGCDLIYKLNKHYPVTLFSILLTASGALIGSAIGVLLTRKTFTIDISNGNISGPGGSVMLKKEILPVADLEVQNFSKQSFYEKISGFYSIRSKNGQRIIFTPFIYDKVAKDKVYRAITQTLSGE
ncbi:MAG: hypothetical protein CVU44_08010 [Chloroflexi bacterium HGW-Chloroflexi-6]|nr:MAG: hypothetical protein CVU44_08010 [Chloroflexi bacterium HGW-Chloroflexi-6]